MKTKYLNKLIESVLNKDMDKAKEFVHKHITYLFSKNINENWDTDEVYNWVSNDEGLYNAASEFKSGEELYNYLKEIGFDFKGYGINPDKVNWSEVLNDVTDSEEDQRDHDPDADECDEHEWVYTGTAYGGDDPSYGGEGRVYCSKCGADGDA
jgi:hypothetical protein